MAHKKAGGSTSLGRDSESKRLGVKVFGGQRAAAGNVIVKQRGTKFGLGKGVALGSDDTIYALHPGTVKFQKKLKRGFNGKLQKKTVVSVVPRAS